VYNQKLVSSFVAYRIILSDRHRGDPNIFAKTDWKSATNPERREWIIQMYRKFVDKFVWNSDSDGDLPVIVAVHGTSNTIAQKICRTGFAALSALDAGFYGQGIYFTCHIPYIFPYVANVKDPAILFVLLFPGNIYPIIEKPTDPNSFLGKPMKSGYQCHYVITSRNGYPATVGAEKTNELYDELVITQESQILPIYLVQLDISNFGLLAQKWQRAIPKSEGNVSYGE